MFLFLQTEELVEALHLAVARERLRVSAGRRLCDLQGGAVS